MSDLERLGRRLERERAARKEAELIAERSTRELFERNKDLVLLESVADAANRAADVDEALSLALEQRPALAESTAAPT